MVSLTTTNTHIAKFHKPFSGLNYPLNPSLILVYNPQKWPKTYKKAAILKRSLGFIEVRKFERNLDSSWCCLCKESEGDSELEGEIMDFMAKSEKPSMFPTKGELIRAGRMDLVRAIRERGGWYSLGWDDENVGDEVEEAVELDIGEFHRRVESCNESASLREYNDNSLSGHENEDGFLPAVNLNSANLDSLQMATSASLDRSLEIGANEDTGIEGILSRLEKQRNSELGINLGKKGYEAHVASKDEGDDGHLNASLDIVMSSFNSLLVYFHSKGKSDNPSGKISPSIEPESWRTWSNQRAGFQYTEFEAAEISFSKNLVDRDKETYHDGITVATEEYAEGWERHGDINHNQIRTRLQHLEFELNTALRSLRSKRDKCISEEVIGNSSEFQKLSDAYEFQENEFMSGQERLRSIRAKLAILEGKMALAIIDAQKMVEEKQKRIDGARRAMQLLRTTSIVWPNSASEVLLAGSFDGWTTQRKMEKSRTGIFSVCLKLYPGRYEIKFVVDGKWKIDPLRPIVNNNGYENNLLIVT
ncbi:hypothetical protein BUALT_Bualt17G0060800 [Buddleja alternifolia]|uniref:AMP-activated protein kinase glycogen-binding domain-containing protein n=1 Tax=Buddleja alternifolia TaxID=168488 RepID=A0AAV6W820_9LAMI|nr:hypothetical protein BUALT_Bualt17G0060800 [Buddleja alternifolia]